MSDIIKENIKNLVNYKGIEYTVINPGEFLKDEKGYLIDQLNPSLPRMGRYRSVYLKNTYNLSEFDYYVIIMYLGDENLVPICEYEGCDSKKQFNHLLATKKEPVFELGCCSKHTRILTNRISGRRLIEEGRSPILKALATPITDNKREKHRQAALEQVKQGKHPWQKGNRSEKVIKTTSNFYSNMSLEEVIIFERESYLSRGNLNDTCCLYITFLSDTNKFKIGVTKNLHKRSSQIYHGLRYVNPISLLESTREKVANLEYSIKMEFKTFIILGTETFPMSIYEKVLFYISSEINKLSSTTIN